MIDVCLKARLGDKKENIVLNLEKKGAKIKKGKEQLDKIFIKNDVQNFDLKPGDNILKLRQEENKTIFSLKQMTEKQGKFIEVESLVSDEEEIKQIINLIGYKEVLEIKRNRTKYFLDGLTINIDYIEDLDYFIEINKTINDEKEESIVKSNMENLLNEIGIEKDEYILDSYEYLKYKEENNKCSN